MIRVVGLLFFVIFPLHSANAIVLEALGFNSATRTASREAQRTITHARAEAEKLIRLGSKEASARLANIDKIVDGALADLASLENQTANDVERILGALVKDVSEIEAQLFKELNQLAWSVECGARRVLLEDMNDFLGDFVKILGLQKIVIEPPVSNSRSSVSVWCFWCDKQNEFRIKQPFGHTYIDVRDYVLSSIDEYATEETPAHAIVGNYEFLASFALKASCFYPGGSVQLLREHVRFAALANNWTKLLNPEVAK